MAEKLLAVERSSNSVTGTVLVKDRHLRAGTGIVLVVEADPYSRSGLARQNPDHVRPSVAAHKLPNYSHAGTPPAVELVGPLALDLRGALEECQCYLQPMLHLYSLLRSVSRISASDRGGLPVSDASGMMLF